MSDEQWGVGSKADAEAFATVELEGYGQAELIFGEHPHSRGGSNNTYARLPNGEIEPFDGHRPRLSMTFESYNYLKESDLSGNEVRKGGNATLLVDGEPVYGFFFRDPQRALLEMHSIVDRLIERLPDCILDKRKRTELVGRKVYYKDVPAVVKYFFPDQGAIVFETEDPDETFPQSHYDAEEGFEPENHVKVDVLSSDISWWRS